MGLLVAGSPEICCKETVGAVCRELYDGHIERTIIVFIDTATECGLKSTGGSRVAGTKSDTAGIETSIRRRRSGITPVILCTARKGGENQPGIDHNGCFGIVIAGFEPHHVSLDHIFAIHFLASAFPHLVAVRI